MMFDWNEINENNGFLNILLDNINSAILVVDKDSKIRNINRTCEQLMGKGFDDIFGETLGDAISCLTLKDNGKRCGESTECERCRIRQAVELTFKESNGLVRQQMEKEVFLGEIRIVKYLLLSTKYLRYRDEGLVLVIIEDVTELEMQKRKLEEINRQKNLYLGVVAHDLRNPLGAISIYIDYLIYDLKKKLNNEEIDFLKTIKSSTRFMNQLIGDLLDLTQIEAGELSLNPERLAYLEFLANVLKIYKPIAKQKNIDITLCPKIGETELLFDKYKLEQVVQRTLSGMRLSFRRRNRRSVWMWRNAAG